MSNNSEQKQLTLDELISALLDVRERRGGNSIRPVYCEGGPVYCEGVPIHGVLEGDSEIVLKGPRS